MIVRHAPDLRTRAVAVRALADLMRSGMSVRQALRSWPQHVPIDLHPGIAAVCRKAGLGSPEAAAVAGASFLGEDATQIALILRVHAWMGGDLATMLDRLASVIESRADAHDAGRAAVAGAVLSARMIAGLPLLLLAFGPAWGRLDGVALAAMALGLTLVGTGMAWLGRLVPAPDRPEDVVAGLADLLSCVVAGGVAVETALEALSSAGAGPVAAILRGPRRRAQLGLPWALALSTSAVAELHPLGALLTQTRALGVPCADALASFARLRRLCGRRAFDASTKKAPVAMTVPLVACVLPSYILLGIVPFLRGLAAGT